MFALSLPSLLFELRSIRCDTETPDQPGGPTADPSPLSSANAITMRGTGIDTRESPEPAAAAPAIRQLAKVSTKPADKGFKQKRGRRVK